MFKSLQILAKEWLIMANTKPLTAAERVRRKKIRALIRDARVFAKEHRLRYELYTARLLDDLTDVAEEYLEGLK